MAAVTSGAAPASGAARDCAVAPGACSTLVTPRRGVDLRGGDA